MEISKNTKLINDLMRINVLEEELEYYKTLIQEHDTGHIHTAIAWMQERLRSLMKKPNLGD